MDKLKDLMAHYKLEIPVLSTYLPITEKRIILQVFEAAEILNAIGVRVSLGPPLDGKRSYWDVHSEALQELEIFLKSIKQYKTRALFEIHLKTLIPSPSSAYILLSKFDPNHFGVIFDPANMIFEGYEDWKMGIEILGNYLGHVHVKNASWIKEEKWICKIPCSHLH